MKKLNTPRFEEDLKTFPKKPIWMNQMIKPNHTSPSVHILLIILILCLIILAFL